MDTGPAANLRVSIVRRCMSCDLLMLCTISVVENWVAVIVSCMPAFANFCRLYISESQRFKSLQYRFFSWASSISTTSKKQLAERDASHLSSQRDSKARASSNTGPYYKLDERRSVTNAVSNPIPSAETFDRVSTV